MHHRCISSGDFLKVYSFFLLALLFISITIHFGECSIRNLTKHVVIEISEMTSKKQGTRGDTFAPVMHYIYVYSILPVRYQSMMGQNDHNKKFCEFPFLHLIFYEYVEGFHIVCKDMFFFKNYGIYLSGLSILYENDKKIKENNKRRISEQYHRKS